MNLLPHQCLRDQSLPFPENLPEYLFTLLCVTPQTAEEKEQAEFGRVILPFAPLAVQT